MAYVFCVNAQIVLNFLKTNPSVDMTAAVIAEAVGLTSRTVNGVVTGLGRRKHALAYREAVELDGKTVKYVRLTDEGMAVDPLAEKEE